MHDILTILETNDFFSNRCVMDAIAKIKNNFMLAMAILWLSTVPTKIKVDFLFTVQRYLFLPCNKAPGRMGL